MLERCSFFTQNTFLIIRTGREVNLKYIDAADLATNKIRLVPKEDRETDPGAGTGPDAEDLMVLKRKVVLSSPKNAVGGRASRSRGAKVSVAGGRSMSRE